MMCQTSCQTDHQVFTVCLLLMLIIHNMLELTKIIKNTDTDYGIAPFMYYSVNCKSVTELTDGIHDS